MGDMNLGHRVDGLKVISYYFGGLIVQSSNFFKALLYVYASDRHSSVYYFC